MHVNVKIYIRFQILLVWTFTEYYINIFEGAERYSGPPRNNPASYAPDKAYANSAMCAACFLYCSLAQIT